METMRMPCALCSNVNTIRILYQSPLHHILCTMVIMYRYVVTSVLKKQQISLIHVHVVLVCLDFVKQKNKNKGRCRFTKRNKVGDTTVLIRSKVFTDFHANEFSSTSCCNRNVFLAKNLLS